MHTRILYLLSLGTLLCVTAAPHAVYAKPSGIAADTDTIELPLRDDPLALFIDQKELWLVANTASHISADNVRKPDLHFITGVKSLPAPNATVLILSLNDDVSASVEKADASIKIIVQRNVNKPAKPLVPFIVSDEAKRYLLSIETKTAKNVLSFTDPNTGSEFKVIPLSEPGNGFYPGRSFAQFNILQSIQGVVVRKLADDIKVDVNKSNVEISTPQGLKISSGIVDLINNPPETGSDSSTLFPYEKWKLSDNKNFVPTQMKLFHEIAYGDTQSANKARLHLLELYLSQGMFAESIGMSDDILRNSYKFYRANKVAAMRGAANFFMQHIEDAERDFSSPELADDKEAAIWRTLCGQLLGEEEKNVFNFPANYDAYISKYPPPFIQKLALLAADLSIKRKEYDNASEIFRVITKASLDEPIQKYIEYMQAEILSETNNEEEAQKIWEKQVGYIDDPLIRASAEFSLINMLIRQDKIATDKAIKKLEKLRIVWRGDALEMNILTLLGTFYLEEKDYSKALHTMKDIVQYFPNSPQVLPITEKMEEVFTNLYNKGYADNMPPLEALTLFYEFRDLVPNGKDGDMMIRNLADKLVGIDLLDRAAMLLDHQVTKRLQGSERSRIGARLAAIYLQNHKPKDALDILKTTGYGDLAPDVQLERTRLTAQALAEQGHSDKSIEVLNNDNSPEGNLLRLAIYWDNKDWPNVTLTAEEILGNRNDPTAPLTMEESEVLLKLATSYVYEHDNGQIQYLRDYFTPLLKDNPNKQSFLFITSETGSLDYTNLATLDNEIKTVKSFIDTSRKESKNEAKP